MGGAATPEELPLDAQVHVEFRARGDQMLPRVPSRGVRMTSMHGGQIAIAGGSETNEIGVLPDRSPIQLHAEAAFNALADAGLTVGSTAP